MKVIIEFDHAVNDFEINDFIKSMEDSPAVYKIYKEVNCQNCSNHIDMQDNNIGCKIGGCKEK
jgi:hypothetical protein